MSNDYRGVPIPQTPAQKANFDKTYRSVYGTRVKIPVGLEFDALVEKIRDRVGPVRVSSGDVVAILNALAMEEGT